MQVELYVKVGYCNAACSLLPSGKSQYKRTSKPPVSMSTRNRQKMKRGLLDSPSLDSPYYVHDPVWRVGFEVSRSEPERSEGERSEADDRSPTSQTGFKQIWRRSGEIKPVA